MSLHTPWREFADDFDLHDGHPQVPPRPPTPVEWITTSVALAFLTIVVTTPIWAHFLHM
jgi:hypothetical protein